MTLFELLDRIEQRPSMYFGEATLPRFEAFLLGWLLESTDSETQEFMDGFQKWISARYRVKTSHSWASIIRFYAKDDMSALVDAFSLLHEYRKLHSEEDRAKPPTSDSSGSLA